jgi:hypothetical protein
MFFTRLKRKTKARTRFVSFRCLFMFHTGRALQLSRQVEAGTIKLSGGKGQGKKKWGQTEKMSPGGHSKCSMTSFAKSYICSLIMNIGVSWKI